MCWDRVFSFTPPRRLADMNEGVRQAQRIEETQNLGEETETLILHWMVKNKHNDIVDLGKQDTKDGSAKRQRTALLPCLEHARGA